MLLPFHRGYETWPQRLQAVELALRIERLQVTKPDYAVIANGLHLPLSADFYQYLASPAYLGTQFGDRYAIKQDSLLCSFKALQEACATSGAKHIHDLGAEFDFSISLFIDQQIIQNSDSTEILRKTDVNEPSAEFRQCLEAGLTHYRKNAFKEALHNFREMLLIEPSVYPILYRIALIYLNSPEWVHEANACFYFRHCAELAQFRNDLPMAAQAYLHASFAAFLQTKDQEAVQLVRQAIALDSSLAESYYHYAKISAHDSDTALIKLHTAIMLDRNYVIKVSADLDLEHIHAALFTSLRKQAGERAAAQLAELLKERELEQMIERSIKEHEVTIGQVGAHRQIFDQIKHQFDELMELYERNTFFDFIQFSVRCDQYMQSWQNPSLSEAVKNRFLQLLELSKGYHNLEKESKTFSFSYQFAKFFSWLCLNLAFGAGMFSAHRLFHISSDWFAIIPLFFVLSLLVAYADTLFDHLDRMLYYITITWLRIRPDDAWRTRIERFMQKYFNALFIILNALFTLHGVAIWIAAGRNRPPLWLFVWILCSLVLLQVYRFYLDRTMARLATKRALDQKLATLINSELK